MDVPETVRRKARLAGAAGWLATLPELVAGLERDWSITLGPTYGDATEAFVARATAADGRPAVLKVLVPRDADAAAHELTVLRLAAGEGCVRLLRYDVERGAMLLERLGRPLHELALPFGRRLEILCSLAARVWRPAPGYGLPTGVDKGRWLAEFVSRTWEDTGRPCTARAVDHALTCAQRRIAAHEDERAVLVHGDVHEWNALQTPDGGFTLVDPDGLLAEPEYDLGVLMREDPVQLMRGDPRRRAAGLARRTGLDATAIWEWGIVERVSTGLVCETVGMQPIGRHMLAAADAIARDWPAGP